MVTIKIKRAWSINMHGHGLYIAMAYTIFVIVIVGNFVAIKCQSYRAQRDGKKT